MESFRNFTGNVTPLCNPSNDAAWCWLDAALVWVCVLVRVCVGSSVCQFECVLVQVCVGSSVCMSGVCWYLVWLETVCAPKGLCRSDQYLSLWHLSKRLCVYACHYHCVIMELLCAPLLTNGLVCHPMMHLGKHAIMMLSVGGLAQLAPAISITLCVYVWVCVCVCVMPVIPLWGRLVWWASVSV